MSETWNRGQRPMVICHNARKGGNTGSHWSKPVALPLHSTSKIAGNESNGNEILREARSVEKQCQLDSVYTTQEQCSATPPAQANASDVLRNTASAWALVTLCLLAVLTGGCGRTPESARKELGALHKQFNADDFYQTINDGDKIAVDLYLAAGMDVNTRFNGEVTPLMLAAAKGHDDIVKALADKGTDINATDGQGKTALMLAAANGHARIVNALVDRKPQLDAKDEGGKTAADYAATHEIEELLRTAGAKVPTEYTLTLARGEMLAKQQKQFEAELPGTYVEYDESAAGGKRFVGYWKVFRSRSGNDESTVAHRWTTNLETCWFDVKDTNRVAVRLYAQGRSPFVQTDYPARTLHLQAEGKDLFEEGKRIRIERQPDNDAEAAKKIAGRYVQHLPRVQLIRYFGDDPFDSAQWDFNEGGIEVRPLVPNKSMRKQWLVGAYDLVSNKVCIHAGGDSGDPQYTWFLVLKEEGLCSDGGEVVLRRLPAGQEAEH